MQGSIYLYLNAYNYCDKSSFVSFIQSTEKLACQINAPVVVINVINSVLCHHFLQIVDFSCGLNDFSQFMKEKLDKVGKKCNFKNYDIVRPKVNLVNCTPFYKIMLE